MIEVPQKSGASYPVSLGEISSGDPTPVRLRLDYLDGVRALAALYVCIHHTMLTSLYLHRPDVYAGLSATGIHILDFLWQGHFAVSLFIVLSGYCLMLPVAKRGDSRMPGGIPAFLRRRARRILPPYYAALALSLLLTIVVPGMKHPKASYWSLALPIWKPGTVISHLLLLQNWSGDWRYKIDPPMWSMAIEAQIYLIFAFLLLPLARRVGVAGTTAVVLWAGLELHWYFNEAYDDIYWSYVGLFSLGMLGAVVGFSAAPWAKFCRERLPLGVIAAFVWALLVRLFLSPGQHWMQDHYCLSDPLLGAATMCLLVYCTQAIATTSSRPLPLILRVLQARPLVQLGGFSYSFYLVHYPTLIVLSLVLTPLAISYPATIWVMFVLAIPVCVPVAYVFHCLFERPFMPGHPATAAAAARAAVLSPAP